MKKTKEQYIEEIRGIFHRYNACITDVDIKEMGFKSFILNNDNNKTIQLAYADEDYLDLDIIENEKVIDTKEMGWDELTDRHAFMLFQIVDQFRRELIKEENLN